MEGSTVFLIDQNLLPFEFRIQELKTYSDCCHAITTMNVRGAGAIGAMAGFAMALAFMEAPSGDFLPFVTKARREIEATRPTARSLFYAIERVFGAGLISREAAVEEAHRIADKDATDSRMIGEIGNVLIPHGARIETHCNAGWLAFVDYGDAGESRSGTGQLYRAVPSTDTCTLTRKHTYVLSPGHSAPPVFFVRTGYEVRKRDQRLTRKYRTSSGKKATAQTALLQR